MEKVTLGTKKENIKYCFRETCFGIVYKDNNFYLTEKNGEISLIGGGVEKNETHIETLKREFLEEAGLTIKKIESFSIDGNSALQGGHHDAQKLTNTTLPLKDEVF